MAPQSRNIDISFSQGHQCVTGRGLEEPRNRGKGRILTESQGMLRLVRSVRPDLYLKLSPDSGGRTEETPSRLLEAEEVDVVSRQPAEHSQLQQWWQLSPPHPCLPHSHQALPPRPLLLPQPQHQPRQRPQHDLRSSLRTQQPQIERGLPQRGSF